MGSDSRFFEVAERLAAEELSKRGFHVRLTPPGRDGGIDIIGSGLAGQVKATRSPVGAPQLQQLVGAAHPVGAELTVFFSVGGYTSAARSFAEQIGMALFEIDLRGVVKPVNHIASILGTSSIDSQYAVPAGRAAEPSSSAATPRSPSSLSVGLNHERHGEYLLAEQAFRAALRAGDGRAKDRLLSLLVKLERIPEAAELAGISGDVSGPHAAENLYAIGRALEDGDDTEGATKIFMLGWRAGSGLCCLRLGFLADDRGDISSTERWYRLGIELGENRCISRLVQLLWDLGRDEEADEWIRHGVDLGDPVCVGISQLRPRGS